MKDRCKQLIHTLNQHLTLHPPAQNQALGELDGLKPQGVLRGLWPPSNRHRCRGQSTPECAGTSARLRYRHKEGRLMASDDRPPSPSGFLYLETASINGNLPPPIPRRARDAFREPAIPQVEFLLPTRSGHSATCPKRRGPPPDRRVLKIKNCSEGKA